jgi:hypothetical protein
MYFSHYVDVHNLWENDMFQLKNGDKSSDSFALKREEKSSGKRLHARQEMIFELSHTIPLERVEKRFGVKARDDVKESVFDLLIRTGRAADFDEAVILLANAFPSKENKPLSILKRLFMLATSFRSKPYSHF